MATPYLGEVRITSFDYPPRGWARCDGAQLAIQQNQALFSVIGTAFGGDGVTNFKLPDMRGGRVAIGAGPQTPLGSASGEATHVLTPNEIPPHTHPWAATADNATAPDIGSTALLAASFPGYAAPAGATTTLVSGTIQPAGSNVGHENRQPFTVVQFIIALQGIYPSNS